MAGQNGHVFSVSCDESVFAGHRLTMVDFREPWCGPCVGEMPDPEKLWQNCREQGFRILGVYQTPGMEEEVDADLKETGVTYPILHYTDAFTVFQAGCVPITVFVDGEGHILRHETDGALLDELRSCGAEAAEELGKTAFAGSNSYAGWEALVLESLK